MGQAEKETQGDIVRLGVLSILNVMLEAAGIPPGGDLIVEILSGMLLTGAEQPLRQANWPYLELFDGLGTEPEEVAAILEKGGYSDE